MKISRWKFAKLNLLYKVNKYRLKENEKKIDFKK